MTDERFDIVIVGGGPSGSSLAIRLASGGRKVLLVDRVKFPRHKLCGEFVSPECVRHFAELGLDQVIYDHDPPEITRTVFYSVRGRSLTIPNARLADGGSHSLGLSRSAMDDLLIQRAVEIGVEVRTETTLRKPIERSGSLAGLHLRSTGGTYSVDAPIAVDATGRGRILARSFEQKSAEKADLLAFKTHLRNAAVEKGSCEIYSYPGGYGGCTAVEGGVYNLCFIVDAAKVRSLGADPKTAAQEIVMQNPRAQQVLNKADFIGDWHAVPIAKFGRESLVPFPGVIAVGDAAAFIDPFTGSGIALALESSKLASEAILSNVNFKEIKDAYRRTYKAAFERRLNFCKMLRLASTSPWLAEASIALLAKSSYLSSLFARATRFNELGPTR